MQAVGFSTTLLAIVFEVFLIAAMLTRKKTAANMCFTIICVLTMVSVAINYVQISSGLAYPVTFRLFLPFGFARFPLLYFYVCFLLDGDFRFDKKSAVHLSAPLIGVVWILWALIFEPDSWSQTSIHEFRHEKFYALLVSLLLLIYYTMAIRARWMQFVVNEKEVSASTDDVRGQWISAILNLCYFMAWLHLIALFAGPSMALWNFNSVWISIFWGAFLVAALNFSPVFSPPRVAPLRLQWHPDQLIQEKEKLKHILESSRLYLEPSLRLNQLAQALELREDQTTQLIRQGFGLSFYDLVNGFRVEHAKSILSAPGGDQKKLLAIAMESGFNSKSVFNEAFKKHTGMTPSAFRKLNSVS